MRCIYPVILLSLLAFLAGCGGGGTVPGGSGGTGTGPVSITLTIVDSRMGSTVALQKGAGAFELVSAQGSQLNFTLPTATTKYALAWTCFEGEQPVFDHLEVVLQATPQDGTAYSLDCGGPHLILPPQLPPGSGTVTGSVDASGIAGATEVFFQGPSNSGFSVNSASGSFSENMPAGTYDMLAVAFGAPNLLAIKILRGQTVPGAINGGNTVAFGSADLFTPQPLTATNVPTGFDSPLTLATFFTSGGTSLGVENSANPMQYLAVPVASTQSGDGYIFSAQTSDTATHHSAIMAKQNTTSSGGGPVTIGLPDPWSYSGPAPAAFPTFTFDYAGFAGFSAITQEASILWVLTSGFTHNNFSIQVLATQSYQNGAMTVTIPDLSSLNFGVGTPRSGAGIQWNASIQAGNSPQVDFFPVLSTNSFVHEVGNAGGYIAP
jgi:hypothetical protein